MSESEYKRFQKQFTYNNVIFAGYTTPEQLDEACKFEFLPTDIIVSTFPRSGTTFTQEIVWQIKNRKNVSKGEKFDDTLVRFPFLEFDYRWFPIFDKSFYEILNSQKEEPYRLIKTHVPYSFIKNNVEKANSKIIVVMRNAKDCLVANYHHAFFFPNGWSGTFDEFFKIFLHDKMYSGSYFDNNLEWWSLRDRDNVLVLFYEDLVFNLRKNVIKIAEFLDEKLLEDEIDKIVFNSSFDTMYNNKKINIQYDNYKFVRKGVVGNWKEYLSDEQNKLLEEKIAEKFEGSGLEFLYE